ncbi:actin remodeling regulator NHS [Lampris incognitus]|uniref:actin remodeling regulator NHS n=1 Tax=Lampris incognitus TaxID=2546036 RepID=UPI0024B4878F|nr:actin remodeling regulator NHS [Lampris incognitus]
MPFAKRIVEPQLLCRHSAPSDEVVLVEDLCSINNVALSRTLRQLSDLAKHACSIFQELEVDLMSTNHRVRGLQDKINKLQQGTSGLDPKQEAVPVSNLDVESKLTVHYQSPWHQQRNVLHPSTRPACVEELHRQAKLSLRVLHRDNQQRRVNNRERRVTIAVSVAPPMPTYPSPRTLCKRHLRSGSLRTERTVRNSGTQSVELQQKFENTRSSSPTECCHFSPWSRKIPPPSDPDAEVVVLGHRPKFPIPNTPTTLDKQTNWYTALPLPTPEERMKTDSQVITSCIVPINVTGKYEVPSLADPSRHVLLRVGFDRDASVRCSLVHSQSLLQRRRKLRRRKTVTGIPRQVHQDLDSDESPGSRERTVIVHTSPETTPCSDDLASRLNTKDSGCQTEDFLISGAPSRRRIRAQRCQGASLSISYSAGNISSLPDSSDTMFTASVGTRLRSRSLPREGCRLMNEGRNDSDEDDEEELSPFETEDFLSGPGELILKDGEESMDDQTMPEHQLGSLKYKQHAESPEHSWMERDRSRMPRQVDLGSCEISSSSDTFSSPIHSVSTTGVLSGQMDHKEDHQSSSGNWSGSSSTCPSQTSETIPPAASPPLTGSSHCDSELSLNAATHTNDDSTSFVLDHYQMDRFQGLRTQRAGSFSSTAMDILEDVGVSAASEGEWSYPHPDPPCPQDLRPEQNREAEGSLGCPSFTSMATYESSYSDKPLSEKADTVSHYSVDTEGYYTSMHFDCGLKGSKSFTYNYAATGSDCSHSDIGDHMIFGRRFLSLKKPKVKPCPPKRSSSLRKICSEGNIPEKREPKITCGQQLPLSSKEGKLHLNLASSLGNVDSPSLIREPLESWGVEGSVELSDLAMFNSTDTHSFKGEGVVQSDYADLWLLNDLKSSDPYRSLSNSSTATGTTVIECIKSQESSESQTSQSGSRATTPSLPSMEGEFKLSSPERLAGLASPSSGYSSQSETPTSSFPSAFFPGPLSPSSGKRKPKVPERKSSLSSLASLSSRDSSKKDLELPIIPPSHLDLSVLHNVISKPLVDRNQMHVLHQIKQQALGPSIVKTVVPTSIESARSHPMAITPTVLHSVQLRSISKESEGRYDKAITDAATRPKCTSVNTVSTLSSSKSLEFRSPPVYNSHHHTLSQESLESLVTPKEGPLGMIDVVRHCDVRNKQDKQAPALLESMTSFRFQSEQSSEQEFCHKGSNNTELNTCQEGEMFKNSPEIRLSAGGTSFESDPFQPQRTKPSDHEPTLCLIKQGPHSDQDSPDTKYDSLDKVPVTSYQSETSQACPTSDDDSNEVEHASPGAPTTSASQDSNEMSTPETEDYFSKESAPSENATFPVNEATRTEDDSVFLSPSKARTTEDLFAMIHRSKRKVLGRKDSTELSMRHRLGAASGNTSFVNPNSPVNPTSPVTPVTPTGLQKVPGPIYRSVKKSSTSNEEFKLLLLKKGSRSDSSYRMSATEILKSPITPKSPGDSLMEGQPRQAEEMPSPMQQQPTSVQEQLSIPLPKANTEGFSSKAFPVPAASRQSRSRIPPPANSSRYGMRSRLFTVPMQAISEGETENSDGSPHDDRSSSGST